MNNETVNNLTELISALKKNGFTSETANTPLTIIMITKTTNPNIFQAKRTQLHRIG